jgi:hypothetical protein
MDSACFEVRYVPLHRSGPVLVFPCDAHGRVPLDSLAQNVRNDYFFARAVVGGQYAPPLIAPCVAP